MLRPAWHRYRLRRPGTDPLSFPERRASSVAILLAAGSSSRFGAPKALLARNGVPLVRYLATILRDGGASTVYVVIGGPYRDDVAAAVDGLTDVETVENPAPDRGMLSSIQAALIASRPVGHPFLVCPCDLPLLTVDPVRGVIGAWDGRSDTIVAPIFGEKRGHPTLFGPKLAPLALELNPEEVGLSALLTRPDARLVLWHSPDNGPVADVDTPADWAIIAPMLASGDKTGNLASTSRSDHA